MRALTITEAALGPDHPAVATDLNNVATVLSPAPEEGAKSGAGAGDAFANSARGTR